MLVELIDKYPDKQWDWRSVSRNPCITIECVLRHIHKPWNWHTLSYTIPKHVQALYSHLPWSRMQYTPHVSIYKHQGYDNSHLTLQYIKNNLNKHLPWGYISYYGEIDIALCSMTFQLSMAGVSQNPSITMKDISDNPDLFWEWNAVMRNPNITMDFIEKNINIINFKSLSCNTFYKHPAIELRKKFQFNNFIKSVIIPDVCKIIEKFI